jgi:hypothetical protein
MKKYLALMSVVFFCCDDTVDLPANPCGFAPPESNFPTYDWPCEECSFNFNLSGAQYKFKGIQLNKSFTSVPTKEGETTLYTFRSPIFNFNFRGPTTVDALLEISGQQSEFRYKHDLYAIDCADFSVSLELIDYCGGIYETQLDIDPIEMKFSYNTIKDVEVISLYTYQDHYAADFLLKGEFTTYLLLDGDYAPLSGTYQILLSAIELK